MNHFKWLALVSALVLAIGFTACSNDDEKKQGGITYAVTSVTKTMLDQAFTNNLTHTGNGKVTYSSSDTAVAVVNETSGEVTIKGLGVATITATVADSSSYTYLIKTANYTLKVVKPEGSISYAVTNMGKTSVDEPFTNTLTKTGDGTVSFASSNIDVADVNAGSGEVTIKGLGQAVITATVADTGIYTYAVKTASYTLDVVKPAGSITFASTSLKKTSVDEPFTNALTQTGDGTVTYTSSTPAVAEVDAASGKITIKGLGQTVITATVENFSIYNYAQTTASYTLSVLNEGVFKFYTKSFTKSLVIDKDKSFTNSDYHVSGDGRLTFSSSNTDVADVHPTNGKVTIKGVGEATITAQIKDTATYIYPVKTAGYQVKVLPYFGEKAPDTAKDVGDIILCDGSAIPYKEGLTLDKDSKSRAVAVIFYVGKDCSDDDTNRTLGVGMIYFNYEGAWCGWGTEAQNKRIEELECVVNNNTHTFTGHKDGSGNFDRLAAAVNDTGNGNNYPPFKFANNYANETRWDSNQKKDKKGRVSGTKYEKGWYLPSIAELYQLRKNLDAVNAALKVCDGMEIVTELWWNVGTDNSYPTPCGYWSSSTVPGSKEDAWYYDFSADYAHNLWKYPNDNYKYSCAIHAFD
ncbi:MAG: Ig-like domain-containing protein [Treponema sp.]|nr:Ig-like domain-containing protein [Treponema sp.]